MSPEGAEHIAAVIELGGPMHDEAMNAMKALQQRFGIDFILNGAAAPHIMLSSGRCGDAGAVVESLRSALADTGPFDLTADGLGIFVRETPVVHVRWRATDELAALQRACASTLARSCQEQGAYTSPVEWQAKATLAFNDISYVQLSDVLEVLRTFDFTQVMRVEHVAVHRIETARDSVLARIGLNG